MQRGKTGYRETPPINCTKTFIQRVSSVSNQLLYLGLDCYIHKQCGGPFHEKYSKSHKDATHLQYNKDVTDANHFEDLKHSEHLFKQAF